MDGAQLTNEGAIALNAVSLTLGAAMHCRVWNHPDLTRVTPFTATGQVSLYGAKIGGSLDMTGAQLSNVGDVALLATRITVGASMFCQAWDRSNITKLTRFTAIGQVGLYGAKIGGNLEMAGALLTNEGDIALSADHSTVDGAMICRAWDHLDRAGVTPFSATGQVSLYGAKIAGGLDMGGASLSTYGARHTLLVEGAAMGQDVYFGPARSDDGTYYREADGKLVAPFRAIAGSPSRTATST